MPIDPDEIAVDRCYATSTHQVRKVLMVIDSNVKYIPRVGLSKLGWHKGSAQWIGKYNFAAEVDREVSSGWQPEHS